MKKTFKLFAILMMLLLCTTLLASCGDALTLKKAQADPYGVLMAAIEKQNADITSRLSGVSGALESISKGTATYSFELSLPDSGGSSVEEISAEVVVDAESGTYSGEAGIGPKGALITGEIWGDKNQFALSVPMLLGSDAYGVKFDTFFEDLENSSTLALFGISWADLKEQMGIDPQDMFAKFTSQDFRAATEQYITATEELAKSMTPVVAEEMLGEVDTVTVVYTYTKADIIKSGEAMDTYFKAIMGDLLEVAEVEYNMDLENMPETTAYKYYLAKETGRVVKMEITWDGTAGAVINFSTDENKPLDMEMTLNTEAEGQQIQAKLRLGEVTEEGKSGIVMDMEVTADGETHTMTMSFIRDNADGKYRLVLAADGEEAVMAGALTYTDTELRFTVDSMVIPGEAVYFDSFAVTAKTGGEVEAIPEYKNVLNLTAADITAIFENFQ